MAVKMVNGFPRRATIELMTPAEKAIYDAMGEVEKVGAEVKLTTAVMKLQEAKDALSDYIDEHLDDKE